MAYKKRELAHRQERKNREEAFTAQLLQSQIEVQEQTFQQIGKELHDNVGQLLSTSRMLIGITERGLPQPPDTLLTANKTLGEAIRELRALSRSLDKDWLEKFSFIENLKTVISRINSGNTIKASLSDDEEIALPTSRQIILFRIVQESVQNAIKHGQCSYISIELFREQDNILITVKDDGIGFDPSAVRTGMGLANMKYRVTLLNGSIHWAPRRTGGTTVTISVPNTQSHPI